MRWIYTKWHLNILKSKKLQQMPCDPDLVWFSRCNTAALAIVLNAVILCVTPRGSALQKRLRDREKEMEADERDRKREKEELEEIRQRLLDEGHPDPDAELRRVRLSIIFIMCVSAWMSVVGALAVVFLKVTCLSASRLISSFHFSLSDDLLFCKIQ